MTENIWAYNKAAGKLSPLSGKSTLEGRLQKSIELVVRRQHMRRDIWNSFINPFRTLSDTFDGGWRGEYWGKMIRGGVIIYTYTRDEALYSALEGAARLLLPVTREDGIYSTYAMDNELFRWDVWCRKYVMLGFAYFYDICRDEALKAEILDAVRREADGLMEKIGPGKMAICDTSNVWGGNNSCSVLEPVVWLYKHTNEKKYLDFATYIVENTNGGGENMFLLAEKDELYPHEYPIKKAYEDMSCFEGLLEYSLVTGEKRWEKVVCNFVRRICEMELSIIGNCGSEEEIFDGCTKKQSTSTHPIMQETCVTVTWMKLAYRVAVLTGDASLFEEVEKSLYNAMLGAVNFENAPENGGMPFDSYTALTFGTRARGIGGIRTLDHGKFYGCCGSIGSAGLGIGALFTVMENEEGLAFQTYQKGTLSFEKEGKKAEIEVDTAYPYDGAVKIRFREAKGTFAVAFRIPAWCEKATVRVCGEEMEAAGGGYITVRREWKSGDVVEILFPLEVKAYALRGYVAFKRGAAVLARDIRFDENAGKPLSLSVPDTKMPTEIDVVEKAEILPDDTAQLKLRITLSGGETVTLIDFASAGLTWNADSAYEIWIKA